MFGTFFGALVISLGIGSAFNSWLVVAITFVVSIVIAVIGEAVRPGTFT